MPSIYAANKLEGPRKSTTGLNINPSKMIDTEAQASNRMHSKSIVLPAYVPLFYPSNKQLNDTSSVVSFTTAPYYQSEAATNYTKKASTESIYGNNAILTTKKYKLPKNTNSGLFVSERKKKHGRQVRSLRANTNDVAKWMKFDTATTSTRFGNTFGNCEEEKVFVSSRASLKNKVVAGEKNKNSPLRSKANDNCDRVSSHLKRELSTKWCNLVSKTSFSHIANNTHLQNKLEDQHENDLTKKWKCEIVQNTSFCPKEPAKIEDADKLELQLKKNLSIRNGKSVENFKPTTTHPKVKPNTTTAFDENLITESVSVSEKTCVEKQPAVLKRLEAGSNSSVVGAKPSEDVTRVIRFKGDTIKIPRVYKKQPAVLKRLEAGSNNYFVGAKPFEQATRVIRLKGDTIKIPRVYKKQPAVLTCLEAGSNSYFVGSKPFAVAQVASKVIRFKGDTIKIPRVYKKQPAMLTCLEAGTNSYVVGTKPLKQATKVIKFKGDTIKFPRVYKKQPAMLTCLEVGSNCSVISPDTSVIEEQVATPVIKVKGNRFAFSQARSSVESLLKGEVPTHSEYEFNVIDDALEMNSPKIAAEIETSESFSTDQSEEPALKLHNDAGTPEIPEINKVLLLLLDIEYKEFLLEHADILHCLAKLENGILEAAIAAEIYDDVAAKVTDGVAQLGLTSNENKSNDFDLMVKLSRDVAKMKEGSLSAYTEFMNQYHHMKITLINGDEVAEKEAARTEAGPIVAEAVPTNYNVEDLDEFDPSRLPSNEHKRTVDEDNSQPAANKQTAHDIELKSFLHELIELSVIYYDDLPECLKPLVDDTEEEEEAEVSSGDVESKSKNSVEFTPLRLPSNGHNRFVQGEVAQPSVVGPEGHHGDDLLQQV
ncbi:hypothetical protein I9W82_001236 [Candida metapsilosis]|uniref:Uncharacterized protein n=1 Tax=Candida metapsilosis TaxID=273372 RepID=A0A8H7ZHH7_9ASCO|nr:hypothetical protein I9W82_001236 [Candida metapsilosis]